MRVFLSTYRRPSLLPRALRSLLEQSLTDWVCEVHNDAPDDPVPAQLCAECGDSRISLVTHPRNLGVVGTSNLMFEPLRERYLSLLEDDNWWEPSFLSRMVAELDAHPGATVAWANMRIWREEKDGRWTDTQQTVWPRTAGAQTELFEWPHPRQCTGALHSTGAMLVRTGALDGLKVPLKTRTDFVEPVRERAFPHPLLFVPDPLANFAMTLGSARNSSRSGLVEHQVLLMASFFAHARPDDSAVKAIWAAARASSVRSTDVLLLSALYARECQPLLRYARLREWWLCIAAQARHPISFWHAMRAGRRYPELRSYLDRHTLERSAGNWDAVRNMELKPDAHAV